MRQIILASTSPRRKQLLELLGIKFKIVDSKYAEVLHQHFSHGKLVEFLSLGKAKATAKKYKKAVIIASDTVVSFNNKAIGKPKNKQEAFLMLKGFSGKSNVIYSGLAIIDAQTNKTFVGHGKAKVYFKKFSDLEIQKYVQSGEPLSRAGAYAAQEKGFNLVKKIKGDITALIGMPMGLLYNALRDFNIKIQ